MAKILNFGSLNIDKTYVVDEIVKVSQTINSNKYEEFIGGKGLNQSIGIRRAHGDVYHAGLVGDLDGDILVDFLKNEGVDVSYIKKIPHPSGHALIQIDGDGNNSIIVYGGANRMVSREYIDFVLNDFSKGDYLLIQNEISNIPYLVDRAYDLGMVICFNPSPMDSYVKEVDLSKIRYFLLNEGEAIAISGRENIEDILRYMKDKYVDSRVILTLGDKGAIYSDKDNYFKVDGRKVNVVDTTGAGDCFSGYFISSIVNGMDIKEALNISNLASSISCTIKGASNSIPRMEDIYEGNY